MYSFLSLVTWVSDEDDDDDGSGDAEMKKYEWKGKTIFKTFLSTTQSR